MKVLHPNNIVVFKDDVNEVPYLVHDVLFNNNKPVKISSGCMRRFACRNFKLSPNFIANFLIHLVISMYYFCLTYKNLKL